MRPDSEFSAPQRAHDAQSTGESSQSDTGENAQAQHSEAPTLGVIRAYAGDAAAELPIAGYAAMMALFAGSFGAIIAAAARAEVLPERTRAADVLLLGIATHKLTRIVTRERVAIPVRAAFTRYEGTDGAGQVKEAPRGTGLQRAVGSLLTCQYCAGPWVATALSAGLAFAPRTTRFASSMLAMVTIADFLHQAYAGARRWSA